MNFYYSLPDFGYDPREKGFEPQKDPQSLSNYQYQQKALHNIISDLKNSRNKIDRISAAWQLGRVTDPRALIALKSKLTEEKDEDVLGEIIIALGWQKDKSVKKELLQALSNQQTPTIQKRIIWSLGQFGCDDDIVQTLMMLLKNQKNRSILLEIIWIFGENKISQSASLLKEFYFTSHDWQVRKMIVWALAKIEEKEVTEFLINIYSLEKNEDIKKEIIWQFGKIQDEKTLAFLEKILPKEPLDLQRLIVWAAGEIQSPARAGLLIKIISNRELDEQVHREAMWILGKNKIASGKNVLLKALADHSRKTKKIAVWALGNIASSASIKMLEKRLKKENDWGIKNDIRWAINQIKMANSYK
jgi:HEAT repeat protein